MQDYVVVRLCKNTPRAGRIQAVTTSTPRGRQGVIEQVGPECRGIEAGARVLVNTDLGVQVGDRLLLPSGGILALLQPADNLLGDR